MIVILPVDTTEYILAFLLIPQNVSVSVIKNYPLRLKTKGIC